MSRKILMSTIALLVLSMVMISPVKAISQEPYWEFCEFDLIDPGERWEADGIRHVKDSYMNGTYKGTLGTGTFEAWNEAITLNLETGEGNFSGRWLITITPQDTIAGTSVGKIRYPFFSGNFTGTDGTGGLEGVKMTGSFVGVHTTPTHVVMYAWGTITYP